MANETKPILAADLMNNKSNISLFGSSTTRRRRSDEESNYTFDYKLMIFGLGLILASVAIIVALYAPQFMPNAIEKLVESLRPEFFYMTLGICIFVACIGSGVVYKSFGKNVKNKEVPLIEPENVNELTFKEFSDLEPEEKDEYISNLVNRNDDMQIEALLSIQSTNSLKDMMCFLHSHQSNNVKFLIEKIESKLPDNKLVVSF